jgi:hypothetical protein
VFVRTHPVVKSEKEVSLSPIASKTPSQVVNALQLRSPTISRQGSQSFSGFQTLREGIKQVNVRRVKQEGLLEKEDKH